MKNVLVLGAGQSAPYLIAYLLKQAESKNWKVTVADRDQSLAAERVGQHAQGTAISLDATDKAAVSELVAQTDLVVNFLAPPFQVPVAKICLEHGKSMVSASYQNPQLKHLHQAAVDKDIVFLTEMGLDPGMDHMSAMKLIDEIKEKGGKIVHFASYGSGVASLDTPANPLKYVVTWNPRNVVMAGEVGAQYLEDGSYKIAPYPEVFQRTWPFEVPGLGIMEAYPNRDSLSYIETYGLNQVKTMIRGTLRHTGYCDTWYQVAKLGLANERLIIPNLEKHSWAELTAMCLPRGPDSSDLDLRVAHHLGINPSGTAMNNLRWLGLFSNEKIATPVRTPAKAMEHLLKTKLAMPEGGKDLVILAHEFIVEYESGKRERMTSTLVTEGEPGGHTGMAKTVGLPAALGAELILDGKLAARGAQIPVSKQIYLPMLKSLEEAGLSFAEASEEIA